MKFSTSKSQLNPSIIWTKPPHRIEEIMATYRPYAGYSAWKDVPKTPTKRKLDWSYIGVWSGILLFCAAFWTGIIVLCARVW